MDPGLSKEERNQISADLIIGFLIGEDDDNDSEKEEAAVEEVTVEEPVDEFIENVTKESPIELEKINITSIKEGELQNQEEKNAPQMTSSKQSTTKRYRSHSVPKCRPKKSNRINPTFVVTKTNQPPI